MKQQLFDSKSIDGVLLNKIQDHDINISSVNLPFINAIVCQDLGKPNQRLPIFSDGFCSTDQIDFAL